MRSPTVVLIEDDSTIRNSLQAFLEVEGFRVLSAGNGEIGLQLIREVGGDCLVLLDLQMPRMSGEELLAVLRDDPEPAIRAVPVLVLTARMETVDHPNVVGFLRKPFDLDQLLQMIKFRSEDFSKNSKGSI